MEERQRIEQLVEKERQYQADFAAEQLEVSNLVADRQEKSSIKPGCAWGMLIGLYIIIGALTML